MQYMINEFEMDTDSGDGLSVTIMYTANNLMDSTYWMQDGQGFEKDYDTWLDDPRLVLSFAVQLPANPSPTLDEIRCLACLNVDENSELVDGDKGFAACYYDDKGNWIDTNGDYQYKPDWFFLGTIEVTNKGNNIKAASKNGWTEEFTWNEWKDKCASETESIYSVGSFHWSSSPMGDVIQIVSEEKFKNVGLKNGENHIKCYGTTGGLMAGYSGVKAEEWEPSIDSDEGESLVGWTSTGTAQLVFLKDADKYLAGTVEDMVFSWWQSCP